MMMGSVCADQQHKFCSSQQLLLNRKSLREIDIPPRKLLSRRTSTAGSEISPAGDMYLDSPRSAEEAFLQKYLPYNGGDDDEEGDPYSSDHFRMYEFKVRRCTRSRSHDWTDCPFAHPGEKARRRDPRRYHYSGTVCAEFRRGACSRGDNCEFAHGVFECWLHPARYRTEACKDGKNCKRKVCFFAHTPRQLRLLPTDSPPMGSPVAAASAAAERKYRKPTNCCLFCHSVTASPTSTLMGMSHFSPPMSPPHSPAAKSRSFPAGFSPISRYADRFDGFESCGGGGSGGSNQFNHGGGGLSYKDVLTELMNSMDSMNVNEEIPHAVSNHSRRNLSWVDVNFNNGVDEQQQFVLSPSTPNPCGSRNFFRSGDSSSSSSSFLSKGGFIDEKQSNDNNGSASACPDLGWVNDLLT